MSYHGADNISRPDEPSPTVTTKDRLALVTVTIHGPPYAVVDIGLRMLPPHELYCAHIAGLASRAVHDAGRKELRAQRRIFCYCGQRDISLQPAIGDK